MAVEDRSVAVVDRTGAVYDIIRQACPDLSVQRFDNRKWLATASRPALAIFAIYRSQDWVGVEASAPAVPTVAVSAASSRTDVSRAWRAGALGLLSVGLPQDAMRRAIMGALRGEAAYSRFAIAEQIKAELRSARHKRS